jgi:hypothetical protein
MCATTVVINKIGGLPKKSCSTFPASVKNQRKVFLIFLWSSLNVLLATAVLWNITFSGTRARGHENVMVW